MNFKLTKIQNFTIVLFAISIVSSNIVAQGPNTKIRIFQQTTIFDSIVTKKDSLFFYAGNQVIATDLDTISDKDWFKQGTLKSPTSINDSIYTAGEVQITDYPNTRGDDTTAHLNNLYTDATGNIKSARREIIPPSPFIDISTASTGNTFDYYTYYNTQLTNIGLTPIAIGDLDFYVFAFDPAVFANVSISATGILTFDVLASSATNSCIDIRFYTK